MAEELRVLFKLVTLVTLVSSSWAQSRQEWLTKGQQTLREAIKLRPNVGVARNVVFFLGDGMGVSTITAARIHKGQLDGGTGEEYELNMEKMPYSGLIKTYNTDQQTPDSAGTATAFFSGVKTRAGLIGVDESVLLKDCTNLKEGALDTVVDWALAEGKSVGIVTTTRITHATPAAAYANIPHRDWESDTDIKDAVNCDSSLQDIAWQLVENNAQIQVILGGGRRAFYNNTTPDPADSSAMGRRSDGKSLVDIWKAKQTDLNRKHEYVWNNDQFKQINANDVDSILGLFNPSHLEYEIDRVETGTKSEPSLSAMTTKAIEILQKNSKGFLLLVEGGRIDHGHHDGFSRRALEDAIAMDAAVKTATTMTRETDTLIMVTADHSHVFNIAGYPARGNPILGFIQIEEPSYRPTDGLPMTTIIYGNGPGPQRTNLTGVDTANKEFKFPNALPLDYETHAGEDVAVFARGPMSHLVGGVHEQNVLALIMGYAACMGPDKSHCTDPDAAAFCASSAEGLVTSVIAVAISWVLGMFLH